MEKIHAKVIEMLHYLVSTKYTCVFNSYFLLSIIKGDSGGGIYMDGTINGTSKLIAAGIVSYGDQCGLVNKPGYKLLLMMIENE